MLINENTRELMIDGSMSCYEALKLELMQDHNNALRDQTEVIQKAFMIPLEKGPFSTLEAILQEIIIAKEDNKPKDNGDVTMQEIADKLDLLFDCRTWEISVCIEDMITKYTLLIEDDSVFYGENLNSMMMYIDEDLIKKG